MFCRAFVGASKKWDAQSVSSRCLILVSLLLLVLAYLPTLQFDYVPQDQWRAFRYATLAQTPLDRGEACIDLIPKYYVATGRPLLWMTECVEHTAVATISDFIYVRPFVLSIVIVTAIYIGNVLAPFLGGQAMGTLAASAFLLAPGYSFMYLQGGPAAIVLLALMLAAGSFDILTKRLEVNATLQRYPIAGLWLPSLLFLSACLIYPSWAFIVIPLAWIEFGFQTDKPLLDRTKRLLVTLTFYLLNALAYYAFARLSVLMLALNGYAPDLGTYAVVMQRGPEIIWQRSFEVAKVLFNLPPLNFSSPPGILFIVAGLFSAIIGWQMREFQKKGLAAALAVTAASFAFTVVVLVAAVSPWLFSHADAIQTRHLIPSYLFFCAATVGLVFVGVRTLFPHFRNLGPFIVLIAFVGPAVAFQNKLSFLEAVNSNVEFQYLRERLNQWLDEKGWIDRRYLLFVLPGSIRSSLASRMLGFAFPGENVILTSSQNPVSIGWMINAVMRERSDHPIGKSIELVDCANNQSCADAIVRNRTKIAIVAIDGRHPVRTFQRPFVINLSTLTERTIEPVIDYIDIPSFKASSQLKNYGPEGLFWTDEPGWHAEANPKYPQRLDVEFHETHVVRTIKFLPQDEASDRAPKDIDIRFSVDGTSWTVTGNFHDLCVPNSPQGWHAVTLARPINARFLQIEILDNCGDPNFLTLRGLKFE